MRSVWLTVLEDLLVVKPLPYTVSDLHAMSSGQLRETSIRISQTDIAFSTPYFMPTKIMEFSAPSDLRALSLLPGGTRYINLTYGGDVQLRGLDHPHPIAVIPGSNSAEDIRIKLYPVSLRQAYILRICSICRYISLSSGCIHIDRI